jgi:hypothetical protein
MQKIFILMLLLLLKNVANAQNTNDRVKSDKEKTKKLLETETGSNDTDKEAVKDYFFSIYPEQLPEWMNNLPVSDGDKIYLLGISDPFMEVEKAKELALLRIKLLASFINNIKVGNMRDYFVSETNGISTDYFLDYTRFLGEANLDLEDIKIIKNHTTRFDEVILLAEIDKSAITANSKNTIKTKADIISKALMIGDKYELIIRSEIDSETIQDQEEKNHHFLSYAINKIINTETTINDELISELPALSLKYASYDDVGKEDFLRDEKMMGYSLRNGIWYAYLTAIFFELADKVHGNAVHISKLQDVFNTNLRTLNREVVSAKVDCERKKIIFFDNQLFIKCD